MRSRKHFDSYLGMKSGELRTKFLAVRWLETHARLLIFAITKN